MMGKERETVREDGKTAENCERSGKRVGTVRDDGKRDGNCEISEKRAGVPLTSACSTCQREKV
jgi:hypothetical protein